MKRMLALKRNGKNGQGNSKSVLALFGFRKKSMQNDIHLRGDNDGVLTEASSAGNAGNLTKQSLINSEILNQVGPISMGRQRLEYFSDAVIAIIITIMVLELKAPHGTDLVALKPVISKFLCYILSFVYLATFWMNHHHLINAAQRVNGKVLLANIHLLFWLSLIPFLTAWMSENKLATIPAVLYGLNLFMSALAYYILTHTLASLHGKGSALARALGNDTKGKLSLVLYLIGIVSSLLNPYLGVAVYILVACLWVIPDLRFEIIVHAR